MIKISDIYEAEQNIKSYINQDNLILADKLSSEAVGNIYLKLENLQRTGSFKIRGAINAISNLSIKQRLHGVVAGSAGNHAQGVALACKLTGVNCTIAMPENAPASKVQATKELGANVVFNGNCFDDALNKALEIQHETGATLLHAFDNNHVIAGQGTIGLEILNKLPEVDNVVVPVGGGGLIAGIALAIKTLKPSVKIYGVEASTVNSLSEALNKQHTVLVPANKTMADGINVRKIGELPFNIIKKYVDEVITVEEHEIANAIKVIAQSQKQVVEGAGAVGVAALLANKLPILGCNNTVIVISGGNIDSATLAKCLTDQY